jgi:hypothetical protein
VPSRVTTAEDLAAGRLASASSSEKSFLGPAKAVDRDSSTRWSSAFVDRQWWKVDLGATRSIGRVSINWEAAYALEYRIETSVDGVSFATAATVTNASPGWKDTAFTARNARYVRIVGVRRATRYGISFFDVRVGGSAAGIQSARAKRKKAGSCRRAGKRAKSTAHRRAHRRAGKRGAAKRRHSCRSKRRAASRRGHSTRQ